MISSGSPFDSVNVLPLDTLRTLARLCLFRANPQDLPSSRELLVGCIAGTLVILFIGYRLLVPDVNPIALAALHTFLLGVSWLILLQTTGKMDRWYQSASALFGSAAMINLVTLPIVSTSLSSGALSQTESASPLSYLLIGLWLWEVVVVARIIRESIEIRMSRALGLSVLISFAIQVAMVSLFSQAS